MDVQMGYDQLRLTPGAWLDLLGGDHGGTATRSQQWAFPGRSWLKTRPLVER